MSQSLEKFDILNIFNIILLLFIILISSNRIIAQISIPEQISPPDSFEFVPVDILFQWYEVYSADSYRIQIALDENFYSIVCDEDGLVNPEFQSSEYILAVNHDENAPIFKVAHMGIVGDIKKLMPEIRKWVIAFLEQEKKS